MDYWIIENDLGEGIAIVCAETDLLQSEYDLLEKKGWVARWVGYPEQAGLFFQNLAHDLEVEERLASS